jgi:hypothetical protein
MFGRLTAALAAKFDVRFLAPVFPRRSCCVDDVTRFPGSPRFTAVNDDDERFDEGDGRSG